MPIIRPHAAQFYKRRISSVTFTSAHLYGNVYILVSGARTLADSSNFRLLGEQTAEFTKMWYSLPWTPMYRRAKCDAASFILGGKIRNRTNTQIHTQNKQTVNDISTPCLSAYVDNKCYTYLRKQTIPIASIASQIPTASVTMITNDMPATLYIHFYSPFMVGKRNIQKWTNRQIDSRRRLTFYNQFYLISNSRYKTLKTPRENVLLYQWTNYFGRVNVMA